MESKTLEALKEMVFYLETKHRTEETLFLRRLIREAWAEQNHPLYGLSDRKMPPALKAYQPLRETQPKHIRDSA